MKIKPYVLLILLLLCGKVSFAQHPIVERIISHDSTLLVQKAKDWRRYIAVAALDKKTHVSYLVTYYGEVRDSARLNETNFQTIIQNKITLFDYYEALANTLIEISTISQTQIRFEGKMDSKWKYSEAAAWIIDDKPGKTSLQRVDAFDKAIRDGMVKKWLLKTNIPESFEQHIKPYPNFNKKEAGTMLAKGDTTFFYNKDNINTVYKAELIRKKAIIRYYKHDGQFIDSVPLNKSKVEVLLKQKTDVFLLYKGWLEMQKHNTIREYKSLDSLIKLKNTAPYKFAGFAAQPKELLELVNREDIKISDKIKHANSIDQRSIAAHLAADYPENTILNKRFLNAINVSYHESYYTGQVRYEITNHLGNVIAVISDKRIQENTGGNNLVRYNADVISSQDFYAFGSEMPQRTFNLEEYRYGFNGKENDNEVKGKGNQQDYGMRIYDPRIGRFLSMDPITDQYPSLTPYQFASNRPIDGIDIDGKEYGTIHINVDALTGKNTANYTPYDPTNWHLYGSKGKGVSYEITRYTTNPSGKITILNSYQIFTERNAKAVGLIPTEYGNYYGATGLFEANKTFGANTKAPSYVASPIDAVDYAAMQHDIGYDKLNAAGPNSLFNDWGTTPIDESAFDSWNSFLHKYKKGDNDPYSKQKITSNEIGAAWRGAELFGNIVEAKKAKISAFIRSNHSDKAYKGPISSRMNAKQLKAMNDYNYQQFLNIYMIKEKDGSFKRAPGKWTKEKNGDWKPKTN